MKTKLFLLIVCFLILFSGTPYPHFIFDENRDKIILVCEEAAGGCREALIYCVLSEFYAMNALDVIYNSPLTDEEHQKLNSLFHKYYFPPPYDTYDFIEIHIEYKEWKEKQMESKFHDDMSKLFREDPEAFEKKRKELVEKTISNASPKNQLKLRVLQAKWDKRMNGAGLEENRLVFAKSMLMDNFINEFKPTIQQLSNIIKKWRVK
jgi:hypothetical protein